MARKRMIDPEFWSDEEIAKWSYPARLFYIGLWNFADDEGRFKAHPSLLKSQIFPYDEKISMKKLMEEISCKVQWYSDNGSKYGYLRNFLKYQRIDRPQPSKIPTPNNQEQLDEQSTNHQEQLEASLKEVKLREDKVRHLEFVFLTEKEHKALIDKFGEATTKEYIENLNNGIGSKGYKYDSHYHAILSWHRKDNKKSGSPVPLTPAQRASMREQNV